MTIGRRTPLDYIFFLRPVLLPPVWTIALLGTIRSGLPHEMPVWLWVAFMVHLAALFGGVYTLNQICDVESDRTNRKLYFLPDGHISIPAAWRFTIGLNAVALSTSFLFGWLHLGLSVFIVALGILYSVGESPWKNRVWLGLLSNAVGHGFIVYQFGFLITDCPPGESWPASGAYALAVAAVYLATTVPDVAGDLASGKRTAAVVWGERTTLVLASSLVTAAIVVALIAGDQYLAWSAAAAWPVFVYAIFRIRAASTAAKAAVGALSIAAAIAYPVYAALLVSGFVATRLFFRWRFGISYPTFV